MGSNRGPMFIKLTPYFLDYSYLKYTTRLVSIVLQMLTELSAKELHENKVKQKRPMLSLHSLLSKNAIM